MMNAETPASTTTVLALTARQNVATLMVSHLRKKVPTTLTKKPGYAIRDCFTWGSISLAQVRSQNFASGLHDLLNLLDSTAVRVLTWRGISMKRSTFLF